MKLIPVSTLVRYLHATRGFGPQQGEQLLEAVCLQLCAELGIANLQVLCNDCNHGKGFWDMTDWRAGSAMP